MILGAILSALSALGPLVSWPGNLIAAYPYKVMIVEGKGVTIYAPLKQIFFPVADLREVTHVAFGYQVRMRRRHRLLSSFYISFRFGEQRHALAQAIQNEIDRARPSAAITH